MTMLELAEAERNAIIRRAGGPGRLKRRRTSTPSPTTSTARALREAGRLSARDLEILQEGAAHDRRFLEILEEQEQSSALSPPTDWTEASTGSFTHKRAPGHRLLASGMNWSHRGPDGRIIKRGSGQQSLTEYARSIPGDWGGSQNASESLTDVARRLIGREPPRPNLATVKLVEGILSRRPSGEDLSEQRERMRKLLVGR